MLQDIFDKISAHLLTQNKRAFDPIEQRCKYRYEDLKCAAGCLIPDEDYSSEMEGRSINEQGYIVFDYFQKRYSNDERTLIIDFQRLHDNYLIPVSEWKNKIAKIAEEFELKFNS